MHKHFQLLLDLDFFYHQCTNGGRGKLGFIQDGFVIEHVKWVQIWPQFCLAIFLPGSKPFINMVSPELDPKRDTESMALEKHDSERDGTGNFPTIGSGHNQRLWQQNIFH